MQKKNNSGTEARNGTGTELTTEQATDIVKKKRGSKWMQDLTSEGGEGTKPGDNARYLRFALASWDLPPINISDPKQVEERLGMYFKYCLENDRKPQIVGMCNWLGVSRQALNEWENGVTRAATHGDIIKRAKGMIEEMWADYMMNGKINPASGIFLSKNWFGYKDQTDVVVTPNNPLDGMNADDAKKRLLEGIPEEEE